LQSIRQTNLDARQRPSRAKASGPAYLLRETFEFWTVPVHTVGRDLPHNSEAKDAVGKPYASLGKPSYNNMSIS